MHNKRLLVSVILLVVCFLPLRSHSAAQPWLGVRYRAKELPAGAHGSVNPLSTIEILGVFPESGAMDAGLKKGDVLLKANGSWMNGLGTLKGILKRSQTGSTVRLEVLRDGKVMKIPMKLTPRPADLRAFMGSVKGSKAEPLPDQFFANADKRKENPKLTILDFWATWCGPCRQTLPKLEKLYAKYEARGLEIIGISQESSTVLSNFLQEYPLNYPQYRDASGLQHRRYGVRAVPTMLFLDKDGYVVEILQGAPDEKYLETLIQRHGGW